MRKKEIKGGKKERKKKSKDVEGRTRIELILKNGKG